MLISRSCESYFFYTYLAAFAEVGRATSSALLSSPGTEWALCPLERCPMRWIHWAPCPCSVNMSGHVRKAHHRPNKVSRRALWISQAQNTWLELCGHERKTLLGFQWRSALWSWILILLVTPGHLHRRVHHKWSYCELMPPSSLIRPDETQRERGGEALGPQ